MPWQPLHVAHNFNVSFNLSKKLNMFIELTANLVDNKNNIEANCDRRECVEGPATTGGVEGRRGTKSRCQVSCDLSYQGQCDRRQ